MNPTLFIYNQAARELLKRLAKELLPTPASEPERFVDRMVRDFPDEMNRGRALDEFVRNPGFWRNFYENDPRDLSKGGESPPDGNFTKPVRPFRPTPLDEILDPSGS